jgi:hypothetical protein
MEKYSTRFTTFRVGWDFERDMDTTLWQSTALP